MIKDGNELKDIIVLINQSQSKEFNLLTPAITQVGFFPNYR
jgi:hypothetical protein